MGEVQSAPYDSVCGYGSQVQQSTIQHVDGILTAAGFLARAIRGRVHKAASHLNPLTFLTSKQLSQATSPQEIHSLFTLTVYSPFASITTPGSPTAANMKFMLALLAAVGVSALPGGGGDDKNWGHGQKLTTECYHTSTCKAVYYTKEKAYTKPVYVAATKTVYKPVTYTTNYPKTYTETKYCTPHHLTPQRSR